MRFAVILGTIAIILLGSGKTLIAQSTDSTKKETNAGAMSMPADTTKVSDTTGKAPSLSPDPDTIFSPEDYVVIETHHRVFQKFLQTDTVKFHQRFQLGDENIFAEVFKFVADLKVTMTGQKIKMSDTLYNPAVEIRVVTVDTLTNKDSVTQESWAFYYGGAPHFSRNAFFAFKLLDFKLANPKYVKPPEGQQQ